MKRTTNLSPRPARKTRETPTTAGRRLLLGSLEEKIQANGKRYFFGTLAGMTYLLTPAKSAVKGERKWNLYVRAVDDSRGKSASQRSRKPR